MLDDNERAYLLERCLRLEHELIKLQRRVPERRAPVSYISHIRRCRDCMTTKPMKEFQRDRAKPSGYRYRCRECQRIINRGRPRPSRAAESAAWKARNPEKMALYRARARERTRLARAQSKRAS